MISRRDVEQRFHALLTRISNSEMRTKVLDIWEEVGAQANWETLHDAKFGPDLPAIKLVDHIESVTSLAVSIAEERSRIYGLPPIDMDLLITAGLLHDVGKMIEFCPAANGKVAVFSQDVQTKHWVIGSLLASKHGLPEEVVNIVFNHSPQNSLHIYSHEGYILYLADVADAALLRSLNGVPLSDAPLKKYK